MKNLNASLLLAMSIALLSIPVQAASTHCKATEKVIFSCDVGKKIVSVCVSDKLSPKSGYIQYRFGPKDAPELLLPDPAAHPRDAATAKTIPYAGGGGSYLRFNKEVYSYIVYSGTGKDWEQAGVVVEKEGKSLTSLICKDKATSELGPDFFGKFEILEDEKDFEIPVK